MSRQVAFFPPELAHSAFGFMGYRLRANLGSRKNCSIITALGGEYKEKQTRRRKLGVLPKFQSKNFLKIQEYPGVDDSEGKKRLHRD